ncbi:sodium-coupled neutral amino acid transporter 7-like [Glandiceps talaboti]
MSVQVKSSRPETTPLLFDNSGRGDASSWLESNGLDSIETSTASTPQATQAPNTNRNSILGAVFIIVNACLGAGVLNFPYAYAAAGGIAVSVLLQTVLVIFACIALLVLAFCSDVHGTNTYENAVASLCGKAVHVGCQITVLFYAFGACITYLIIIADQLDKVFEFIHHGNDFCEYWYYNRKFTLTVVAVLFILPLCFPAKIDFLKYSSLFGVLATIYVVIIVVFQYFSGNYTPPKQLDSHPTSWLDMFAVIPVICFAFQCHLSAVPVYATLQDRSMKTFSKVTALSLSLCFVVYLLTGIFGYLTFGDKVKSDLLQSYDAKDISVTIARFMISISVLTSIPILNFVGRAALHGIMSSMGGMCLFFVHYKERVFRISHTLIWFVATLLLALFIPDIELVISVIGCLAAAFILFYPGICLFKAGVLEVTESNIKNNCLTVIGFFFTVLGAFVFGESLTLAIMDDIRDLETRTISGPPCA